ncbi:MAG: PfkB family carbohydrate kinase, partial [Verrucomicrobiia bacterium]
MSDRLLIAFGAVAWEEPANPSNDGPRRFGGSAAHLATSALRLGSNAALISAVHDDADGATLLQEIAWRGLPLECVRLRSDGPPTAAISVLPSHDHRSQLILPAAAPWDLGQPTAAALRLVAQADAICWNSLSQRDPRARAGLDLLLRAAPSRAWRLFDFDLHPPHLSAAALEHSLMRADVAKLSLHDLSLAAPVLRLPQDPASGLAAIRSTYNLRAAILTLDANRCLLLAEGFNEPLESPAAPPADATSADHAFVAALALGLAHDLPWGDLVEFARISAAQLSVRDHSAAPPTASSSQRFLNQAPPAGRSPRPRPELHPADRADLLRAAAASDAQHILGLRAAHDPDRPRLHFTPPGGWLNDPNAPCHHAGWEHLFYQANPYDTIWPERGAHWGHARSRDFITWEHLPVALAPSASRGERACWSGCALSNASSPAPSLLYTSLDHQGPPGAVTQSATPLDPADETLSHWLRSSSFTPVLTAADHPAPPPEDWRDPYLFTHGNRRFMLQGARRNAALGGNAVVLIYEEDPHSPGGWVYRNELYVSDEDLLPDAPAECPAVAIVGGEMILLFSPYDQIRCVIGTFDPDHLTLRPRWQGRPWIGSSCYAPTLSHHPKWGWIVWCWIRQPLAGVYPDRSRGWAGCLAFPRRLEIDPKGRLRLDLLPAFDAIRQNSIPISPEALDLH